MYTSIILLFIILILILSFIIFQFNEFVKKIKGGKKILKSVTNKNHSNVYTVTNKNHSNVYTDSFTPLHI
jgi:hypothetical protein